MLSHDRYPAWAEQLNTPVTYPAQYVALAREKGLDCASLISEAGLDPQQLADPTRRVAFSAFINLVEALLLRSGDSSIGFETGLRLPLTAHGNLGYALLCSDTPLAAVEILKRFWRLRGRGIRFDFREEPDAYVFSFHGELHLPAALGRVLMEGMVVSFCQGVCFLLGLSELPGEACFDFPEPAHYARFRHRFPQAHYDQPETLVRLTDKSRFQHPLGTANPEALRQALLLCEQEQALWGDDEADHALLARARAEMSLTASGYPTPAELSERLHLSLRTLRRKLLAQGSGYKQLLEEARRRDAMTLLATPSLTIQQVAGMLGYDVPANFTRAFRQWTGRPPSHYRRQRLPTP